ncbi:hypothetical protein [Streptomyces sp. NPDC058674]|uniref:hypothetical protein n=1 Tax=Streptomyces sp. NPDC058674 TaxID=3346592 RepID=UPI00365B929B
MSKDVASDESGAIDSEVLVHGWDEDEEEWDEERPENFEDRQQVARAIALAEKEPGKGVPRLLGMLTDTDLDENGDFELRSDAMAHLRGMGGPAEQAAMWVVEYAHTVYDLTAIYMNSGSASAPPDRDRSPEERRKETISSLAFLTSARELDENLRWRAIDGYLAATGTSGYRQLSEIAPDISLDRAVYGYGCGDDQFTGNLRNLIAQDGDQPLALRIKAIELLWEDSPGAAAGGLASVLEALPMGDRSPVDLVHALSGMTREEIEILLDGLEGDEFSRADSRFHSSVLDALDAAHEMCPSGSLGEVFHTWTREAVVRWGRGAEPKGRLDASEKVALTRLAARYAQVRSVTFTDGCAAQADLFQGISDGDDIWEEFTVGDACRMALHASPDVRCVLRVVPTARPGVRAWQLAVEERDPHGLEVFTGEITELGERSSVDLPDRLMAQADRVRLLFEGIAELS